MQFDGVEEIRAQVETPVSSRVKRVEGGVEELKRGSKALSDGVHEKLGKLDQYALRSVIESAVSGYAHTLTEWTGKTHARVVYDSTADEFTHDGLFQKVKGRPNIAVIGFTTDSDVFGGFYSVAVTKQGYPFYDPNIFAFSFESHGRCETPQRLVANEGLKEKAYARYWKDSCNGFVWLAVFGEGGFCLGNEGSDSYCCDVSRVFEGLVDTTLTEKDGTFYNGPYHHCTRLVAVLLSF